MVSKSPVARMGGMQGGMPGGIHVNMDDILQNLFGFSGGGMGGPGMMPPGMGFPPGMMPPGANIHVFRNGVPININNAMQKPQPIIKTISINMEQVMNGANIPVEIERWILENGNKVFERETIYVSIPKGIDDNEIIMLRDKGNVINEQNKGDIKLFIRVENTTDFKRNGLDLILNKNITLKEALCGFSFDMKYIDGREFKLNNGNGNIIHNNYNKVIQHMGMKRIIPDNQEHIGNLIINFNVVFPEQLREEQITELSKIL